MEKLNESDVPNFNFQDILQQTNHFISSFIFQECPPPKEENHSFEFFKNKICKTCLSRVWEEKVIEGKYVLFGPGPYSEYISADSRMSLLDSFDDSKVKCKKCGKYFNKPLKKSFAEFAKTCQDCVREILFNKFPYQKFK
jgi:hypothetical protein